MLHRNAEYMVAGEIFGQGECDCLIPLDRYIDRGNNIIKLTILAL
jgi:hypothetical protein